MTRRSSPRGLTSHETYRHWSLPRRTLKSCTRVAGVPEPGTNGSVAADRGPEVGRDRLSFHSTAPEGRPWMLRAQLLPAVSRAHRAHARRHALDPGQPSPTRTSSPAIPSQARGVMRPQPSPPPRHPQAPAPGADRALPLPPFKRAPPNSRARLPLRTRIRWPPAHDRLPRRSRIYETQQRRGHYRVPWRPLRKYVRNGCTSNGGTKTPISGPVPSASYQ
jgi:hypothetical protein